MKRSHQLIIALLVILFAILSFSFFVVRQGQHAFVQRLGKIVVSDPSTPKVYGPGLHVKIPFISLARTFDTRLQGFSSGQFSVITAQQTFLEVEYYVKWRITDLVLYYKRTSGVADRAVTLMEPKINDIVRAQFGKMTSNQIISSDRSRIMQTVLSQAKKQILSEYGVEIVDVRLQSAKLPKRVLTSVFSRMASERKQFANNKRAEGLKASEAIKAKADEQVVVIKAQANKQAAVMRATGEQKAAEIYAKAYGQNAKFFAFYQSLQAYKQTFNSEKDFIVLSPDSQFFQYFNRSTSDNVG